jgi:hypothetical protein
MFHQQAYLSLNNVHFHYENPCYHEAIKKRKGLNIIFNVKNSTIFDYYMTLCVKLIPGIHTRQFRNKKGLQPHHLKRNPITIKH